MQAERSEADVVDDTGNEWTEWRGDDTQRAISADAEMTSPLMIASIAPSSRRRKGRRRSGRRPPLLPTPPSAGNSCPWLYMSGSPPRDHSSVSPAAVCGSFPHRSPFVRQYSYPLTSQTSPLKHRRSTDVRFATLDRERRGDEPVWLSEMTPKEHRGSMALHCCVAIVSRCLHTAGARHYAARVAEDCERQRRMTGDLYSDDVEEWTNQLGGVDNSSGWQSTATTGSDRGHDDATSRHYRQSQPMDSQQTDDGKQRTLETPPTSRSVIVRENKPSQREETRRRTRNRSDSDSDSSHRPCVRDLRFRPTSVVQNRPYSVRPTSRGGHTAYDAWRDHRRPRRETFIRDKRSTTNRSVSERKSKKGKLRRYSVSSERSSSSSSALSISSCSRSNSKDRRCSSKHSLTGAHADKTESVQTVRRISQTATDNSNAENLHRATDEHTCTDISPDVGGKPDSALGIDKVHECNSNDANVKQSFSSQNDPVFNAVTSDIGNEASTDSQSTKVRPSENNATSDSALKSPLSDAGCRSETPTADNKEVERQGTSEHSHESCSTKKPCERDSACTENDGRRISPCGRKHRHSRSGSRPTSRNSRLSAERVKSDNNDSICHDHRRESTSKSQERRRRRHSGKRTRSRSRDRRRRKSSRHGIDKEHWTKSDHERHERKRSYGRRRSRSSSRGRNSSSALSESDHNLRTKRDRKRENSGQDQLSDQRRLKAERKRLEKVRKKAERALKKLQQLESNYKETNSHRKKPAEIPTTTTVISVNQEKDLLDENDNKCDWNCAEIKSDQRGCDKSLNAVDVDFIVSYTSPVSSPSVLSETEPNACDDTKLRLEKTSSEKQCDENELQPDLPDRAECGVTCDSCAPATDFTIPTCVVSDSVFVSVANGSDNKLLFDNEFGCQSAVTNDESQTVADVRYCQPVELDGSDLKITGTGSRDDRDIPEPEQLTFLDKMVIQSTEAAATNG